MHTSGETGWVTSDVHQGDGCRSRQEKQKEDRARRAVQLYDSVTIIPSNTKEKLISKTNNVAIISSKERGVCMPGELGGTMTKAMSYDVTPIYE